LPEGDLRNDQMVDFLKKNHSAVMVTVRKNGTPHTALICEKCGKHNSYAPRNEKLDKDLPVYISPYDDKIQPSLLD